MSSRLTTMGDYFRRASKDKTNVINQDNKQDTPVDRSRFARLTAAEAAEDNPWDSLKSTGRKKKGADEYRNKYSRFARFRAAATAALSDDKDWDSWMSTDRKKKDADDYRNHTGQQTSTQKCISCESDGAFYCYECTLIYCKNCKKTHDKIPATRSHKVTDLKTTDHLISRPGVLCNTHKDVYTNACESCTVLICSKCVTTTHKGHDFSDIGLMVQERRQHLAKDVAVLKSGLLKLESEVANIQSMDIESTAEKDMEEIETVKRQIIDVVERHVSFRSNEVDDVLQMQREELKYGLNRKQKVLDQQRTLLTSLERLLEDEHDVSFFMAYNVLRKEIIDVNDVIGNPLTSEIRPLDKRAFLESTVNSIISSFGLCAVEVTDGKVTLKTNQSDKKEKK